MKSVGQQHKTSNVLSAKGKTGSRLSCKKSKGSTVKVGNERRERNSTLDEHIWKSNIELSGQPSPIQPLPLQAQIRETCLQKAAPGILKPVECCKRLKLQLFPIDKVTCQTLEKEKHNPHLELTLGNRKKISSVVNHLKVKWQNSKAASGELVLFPDEARLENLTGHRRWTSEDSDTSAADVYNAVGNPSIFRLRYGWFSNGNLRAKEHQEMSIDGEKNQEHAGSSPKHGPDQPIMLDTPVQSPNKGNPTKRNGGSFLWSDSLSNLSFGALLSKVSPAPDTSRVNALPLQNNRSSQHSLNFDSFDAAIAGLISHQQPKNTSTQPPHSSIWEAEETCHAFQFRRISSSSGNGEVAPLGAAASIHQKKLHVKADACPEPTANLCDPNSKHGASEKSQAELQRRAADDNSVGRMDFCWPESVGHLEYAVSSSRQIIVEDGQSGLIASSLDAFQNFVFK